MIRESKSVDLLLKLPKHMTLYPEMPLEQIESLPSRSGIFERLDVVSVLAMFFAF